MNVGFNGAPCFVEWEQNTNHQALGWKWVVLNPTLNILNTALRDRRVFEVIISLVSSLCFPIEQLLFGWIR